MKKEELRKVEFNIFEKYSPSDIKFKKHSGYFHEWGTVEAEIQTQISVDMYTSKKVLVTKAIVEEITTGKVVLVEPDNITFINP